ncbi:hypothetical protein RI129_010118 [Pyrocoelia pectoralis]|uniref:Ankyrin repeat and MYND domain-containing protein 1 n=1 Tax=Pyrocoelia pectoralis TaxID=417401 RepID=A0AAN7ZJA1_9COLE
MEAKPIRVENVRQFITEYDGPLANNQRDGIGCETYIEVGTSERQQYTGQFFRDSLHGQGEYIWTANEKKTVYEGSFYSSNIHGYGRSLQPDGTIFEGLFKNNIRFGPGVVNYTDTSQTVGLWYGNNLIKLCKVVKPEWLPRITRTSFGKIILLRYKKLVKVCDLETDTAQSVLKSIGADEEVLEKSDTLYNTCIRNPKSLFFNKTLYDSKFFSIKDCYIDTAAESHESLHHESDILRENERTKNIEHLQSELEEIENAISVLESGNDVENSASSNSSEYSQDRNELCATRDELAGKLLLEKSKPRTKKVLITDILAWNNEEIIIDMMKHVFLYRNFEKNMPYLVPNVLIGNRSEFNTPSQYETDCIAFLTYCSEGNLKKISELLLEYGLNPDMCDSMGNSGIMYAAARDRRQTIRALLNFGANLDIYNDECLTPLSMCVLRYLAVQNNVVNWEVAFLKPSLAEEDQIQQWRPHESLASICEYQKSKQSLHFSSSTMYKFYNKVDLVEENDELFPTHMIFRETSELKDLQVRYLQSDEPQPFVLNTECIKPPVQIAQKQRAGDKKKPKEKSISLEPDPEEILRTERLNSIRLTIKTLLDCGADPNEGEVPMPILLTALFTKKIDIVEELLSHKADPNARTLDEELTVIHILCSLQPWEGLVEIAELLLRYSADPNLKANTVHWIQEKEVLLAQRELTQADEGKMPLHLLSMRYDFPTDVSDNISSLAQTLIAGGARPSEYYLGHTPLSLAILRGNVKLVKALLETGKVNPNQRLEEEMGVALGVLILRRYVNIPPYETCDEIIQSLVCYGANPFNSTGPCGNLVEFMMEEFRDMALKGKKKPEPKKGKDNTRQRIKTLLQNVAGFVLDKHIKGWVVKQLYNAVEDQDYDNDVSWSMAKYVPPKEVVDLAQALFYRGEIRVKNQNYDTLSELIEFFAIAHSKTDVNIENALKNFDIRKLPAKSGFLNLPQPQVEKHSDKYDVCYYCYTKENRQLFRCPKCKIVYFCSEKCNLLSNARVKWGHPCKFAFYNDALNSWKKEQQKQGDSGRKTKDIVEKREKKIISKIREGKKALVTKPPRRGDGAKKKRDTRDRESDTSDLGGVVKRKHRLPKTYQCFLEKIAKYWPDLDLSALFVPYALYNDGQLYYRFDFQNVVFGETYSVI